MDKSRLLAFTIVAVVGALLAVGCTRPSTAAAGKIAAEWSRFRGPNGSGVARTTNLPTEFGPGNNEIWRTALPPGHSSPVLSSDHVFLTAVEDEILYTYCLDRLTGEVLWRRAAPRARQERVDERNNPASSTPTTDGANVFVFFGDFGLISYDTAGKERWRMELGPFDNAYGMGASPILIGDLLILVCDQKTGSFIIAVDKKNGMVRWNIERPESTTGHSTPIQYRPPSGPVQLLAPGSFFLSAYALADGQRLWWVSGLAFEMKATPVLAGDARSVYINGTSSSSFEDSYDRRIPSFEEIAGHDADGNQRLSADEIPDELAKSWMRLIDLDDDGALNIYEWERYRAARASNGGLNAFRTGGNRDMTPTNFLWNHDQSIPQAASVLLYQGALYIVNDGGIVTILNPTTGTVFERARLRGAIDNYFASPVAADGKIFMVSETCKVAVLKPGQSLKVLAINDLDDSCYATPALANDTLYLRTRSALFRFGLAGGNSSIVSG